MFTNSLARMVGLKSFDKVNNPYEAHDLLRNEIIKSYIRRALRYYYEWKKNGALKGESRLYGIYNIYLSMLSDFDLIESYLFEIKIKNKAAYTSINGYLHARTYGQIKLDKIFRKSPLTYDTYKQYIDYYVNLLFNSLMRLDKRECPFCSVQKLAGRPQRVLPQPLTGKICFWCQRRVEA